MWNPASIINMMSDDLDITEAVILDHITAILYVGLWSAGKGLTKEKLRPVLTILAHISSGETWLLNESSKP